MATNASPDTIKQLRDEINALKRHLHIVNHHNKIIPLCITGVKLDSPNIQMSNPFYSHPCGYKFCLRTELKQVHNNPDNLDFIVHVCLMQGEFDQELEWPVKARVTIQIRNQNGDSDHIQRSKQIAWQYKSLGDLLPIPVMMDVDVGMLKTGGKEDTVRHLVRDTLKVTVKYMALDSTMS